MTGTPEGALRAAATRVGLGVNEHVDRVNKDVESVCTTCHHVREDLRRAA